MKQSDLKGDIRCRYGLGGRRRNSKCGDLGANPNSKRLFILISNNKDALSRAKKRDKQLAQLVEQLPGKQSVIGSIPILQPNVGRINRMTQHGKC